MNRRDFVKLAALAPLAAPAAEVAAGACAAPAAFAAGEPVREAPRRGKGVA